MHLEGSDKRNAADGNKAFLRRGVAEAGRGTTAFGAPSISLSACLDSCLLLAPNALELESEWEREKEGRRERETE